MRVVPVLLMTFVIVTGCARFPRASVLPMAAEEAEACVGEAVRLAGWKVTGAEDGPDGRRLSLFRPTGVVSPATGPSGTSGTWLDETRYVGTRLEVIGRRATPTDQAGKWSVFIRPAAMAGAELVPEGPGATRLLWLGKDPTALWPVLERCQREG